MTRIESAVRAMAAVNGDDFDTLPKGKSEWTAARGEFQGRYRDINEPMQPDYIVMAEAALAAAYPEIAAGTHWLAPREATEGMLFAGAGSAADWAAMRDAYLKDHPEEQA